MSDHHSRHVEEDPEAQAERENPDEVPLQADLFGIKLRTGFRPKPAVETDPETWRDVLFRVNKGLMAFVSNFFGLLPDALKAARSIVRGLGNLPGGVAERVGRAHEEADRQEESLQETACSGGSRSPEQALEELEVIISRLQSRGIAVILKPLPSGRWSVIAVRPELEDAAEEVARRALMNSASVKPDKVLPGQLEDDEGDLDSVSGDPDDDGGWSYFV